MPPLTPRVSRRSTPLERSPPMRRILACVPRLILPEVRFIAALYLLLAILFAALRFVLLLRNGVLAENIPAAVLAQSFLVGLRFDLAVASYLLIPLLLVLVFLPGRSKGWVLPPFALLVGGLLFLGVAEAEFYREFESRFNTLVFEYLGHPVIVGGMIWDGYPVLRYSALALALIAAFGGVLWWLNRRLLQGREPAPLRFRTAGALLALTLMVFASRGGFASEPLRWGDAFFSEEPFANHLALNGLFTLGRAGWDKTYSRQSFWVKALPPGEAQEITRRMVTLADEEPVRPDEFPLGRRRTPASGSLVTLKKDDSGRPANVVVIMMESFSARFVGALGSKAGLTPAFDEISRRGILFERAFSSGTHTHQGVYATLTSFPNFPGYEYLMKMMEANQDFSDLPTFLDRQGYGSVFLYNGLFSWDNKEGFFRQHGVERFVGTEDYVNPSFRDPVWGVSDHDALTRANAEFRALNEKGPFLGIVLTLSNHAPFNLPAKLPFPRIETDDDMEGRFNAMRYADWALGEFFRQASREEYFKNTLFVVTGDHGFASPPMITPFQLSRFHVPLLFYSPHLFGDEGERRSTVASQVDIVPSVLGLLDLETPLQCWGRNLFSPALKDEGFAVIKPSGGEETAALVEGDRILIVSPKEKPSLFRYSLAFPPESSSDLYVAEEGRGKEMRKRLLAYIQSGILNLRERRLEPPEEGRAATAKAAAPKPVRKL